MDIKGIGVNLLHNQLQTIEACLGTSGKQAAKFITDSVHYV